MATSTYLSNPVVTVNSVDLTDQCTGATVNINYDQLEATDPKMTLTGTFLATLPVVNSLGALGTISVTFNGGAYTTDVTP